MIMLRSLSWKRPEQGECRDLFNLDVEDEDEGERQGALFHDGSIHPQSGMGGPASGSYL